MNSSATSSPSTNGFEPGIERKPFVESEQKKSETTTKDHRRNIESRSWKKTLTFKKGQNICSTLDNWAIFLIILLGLIAILLMVFFVGYLFSNDGIFLATKPKPIADHEKSNVNINEPLTKSVTPLIFKSSATTQNYDEKTTTKSEIFESTTTDPQESIDSDEMVSFHSQIDDDQKSTEEYSGRRVNRPMEDCFVHLAYHGSSGIYTVKRGETKMDVYCDMDTADGGWTVIQRRIDGKESFHNRGWKDYVDGFGSLQGSHWIGLKNIYTLAPSNGNYVTLRIELHGDSCRGEKCSNEPNGFWFGEWDFRIGNHESGYQLDISPATKGNLSAVGNLTDGFYVMSNGQSFTTIDQDMDEQPDFNCAQFRMFGPWWHSNCTSVSLNGFYGDKKPVTRYMMWAYTEPRELGRLGLSYPIHPIKSVIMIKPKF